LNSVVTGFDGATYQARFDALAATGVEVHGEAALVRSFAPTSILDAGCGTGRVAIELARHGIATVGVDVDDSMLAVARRLAPALEWIHDDLSALTLDREFDVVVLAGNVPLFCEPARRAALVTSCAAHVGAVGRLLAGFELRRGFDVAAYDAACEAAGLVLESRWSTWDRLPFGAGSSYAVSVHTR
jgi:SAM-dependent methyltransferase